MKRISATGGKFQNTSSSEDLVKAALLTKLPTTMANWWRLGMLKRSLSIN
ncbi:hypothetical protein H6H01_21415 [Nostoc calcicola FACHB-3891]|nr:hypothetical protein [Nostoc calcicola FACHB-3891]